jgi:hypothetical protein
VRDILARVYPSASRDDIEAKVQVMSQAVKQSSAPGRHASWSQRLSTLFNVGMNRRALSRSCMSPLANMLISSHWLRAASFSATMRLQHSDVLFRLDLFLPGIQECDGGGLSDRWCQLSLHPVCITGQLIPSEAPCTKSR